MCHRSPAYCTFNPNLSWMRLKTSVAWLLRVKRALVLLGQKRKELCISANINKDKLTLLLL